LAPTPQPFKMTTERSAVRDNELIMSSNRFFPSLLPTFPILCLLVPSSCLSFTAVTHVASLSAVPCGLLSFRHSFEFIGYRSESALTRLDVVHPCGLSCRPTPLFLLISPMLSLLFDASLSIHLGRTFTSFHSRLPPQSYFRLPPLRVLELAGRIS
jgi:hypothetical protein